jgi:two-component system, sensor histidine kinase and response regulator
MRKILVIEDEETVRENILELLDAEGFEAIAAQNGRIGVNLAQQHLPDLILCDVRMPELDGYGVLKALRSEPATVAIPLIFLTAKAAKTDLSYGLELGANAYITKPFTLTELLGAISQILSQGDCSSDREQVGC